MKKTKKLLGLGLLGLAALAITTTNAATITYDITSDHATGGLGTPPFGTVTLTENGLNVDFVVNLNTGYSFVTTGAADFMYFKFNATGVVLGDITGFSPGTLAAYTGAFNGDGTGQFAFGIAPQNPVGGINALSGPISFTVDNATIADLTQPNNLGILFVADLLSPNGNTGPADVTVPGVPDGGTTLALLGFALVGIESLRRNLKKA